MYVISSHLDILWLSLNRVRAVVEVKISKIKMNAHFHITEQMQNTVIAKVKVNNILCPPYETKSLILLLALVSF